VREKEREEAKIEERTLNFMITMMMTFSLHSQLQIEPCTKKSTLDFLSLLCSSM
jgi:hypothetical protein